MSFIESESYGHSDSEQHNLGGTHIRLGEPRVQWSTDQQGVNK